MSTSCAERALLVASAAVALLAVAVRLHNVVAFPVLHDFDAGGQALNVVEFFEGHLPNLHSWSGTHPPLYYGLGALLWSVLPEAVPVHVMLRGVSIVSWLAAVVIVWRTLRRIGSAVDAAVVAALLLGVPGILIASCMMTSDALCALFVTATLARLVGNRDDEPPSARQAALTGLLAGLAGLTKETGLGVIGVAAAWYAWRSRRDVGRALRNLLAFGVVAASLAVPHNARWFLALWASPAEFNGSPEKQAVVAAMAGGQQLPPWATWVQLHNALWNDPVAVFFPDEHSVQVIMVAFCVAGLGVLGLAGAGVARLAARRQLVRVWAPLSFAALVAVFLLLQCFRPEGVFYAKATLVLPAVLPVGLALAFGIEAVQGVLGMLLRGALLAVAAGGAMFAWYGWWAPSRAAAPPRITLAGASGSAVHAVKRYFEYRAADPIRTLPLLDAKVQRAHGLRLSRIFVLPLPNQRGLTPAEEDALDLAEARLAWLELYHLIGWLQPAAAELAVTGIDAHEELDDAQVNVRVVAAGTPAPWDTAPVPGWPFPPFEQQFTLRRVNGAWRITAIEPHGVSDANALGAFVAYPTLAQLDRLRSSRRQPPRFPTAGGKPEGKS